MQILDRHLPDFDINEIHEAAVDTSPETAIDRVLRLPAAPDPVVRLLFGMRRIRGGELPIEEFVVDVLGLAMVERTSTSAVAAGKVHRYRLALGFEAAGEPSGGSRLVTETRVADVDLRFRLYWLVVGTFSGLIRRRWLRGVARSR